MNPFAAYSAINTKIHAKKSRLLSDTEWHKLAKSRNVTEVVDFLRSKEVYKDVMMSYKINELHRSHLEVILEQYQVREIEDLLHYFSADYKAFFRTFLMEYDIDDLELILRSIVSHEDMKEIELLFVHSQRWSTVDYQRLLGCKNVGQFIEGLKGTPYYEALKTLVAEDLDKREFHMEMKLYMLYYGELMKKAAKLDAKDAVIARTLIGTKIDYLNVQWIYRALKYYDISPEEILIYSLPYGNRLGYRKLKKLIYSKSLDAFKEQVDQILMYPLFSVATSDAYLDCMTDRNMYKVAKNIQKDNQSIATVIAYLYTLAIEVKDLVALTEGIRYTLSESELSHYLAHNL